MSAAPSPHTPHTPHGHALTHRNSFQSSTSPSPSPVPGRRVKFAASPSVREIAPGKGKRSCPSCSDWWRLKNFLIQIRLDYCSRKPYYLILFACLLKAIFQIMASEFLTKSLPIKSWYVCMVFVDGVYNDEVFNAIASDCICLTEKVRHGFVENQQHQFVWG